MLGAKYKHQDGNTSPATMYDRANNKRIEYKTHDSGNSEQYKYDSAYRLTSTGSGSQGQDARGFERGTFTNANRTSMAGGVGFYQDWDLEGLGNWARQDDNARVETRTHSDYNEIVDRVVSGATATLTHDKNGNVTDTGYSSLGGQSFPGGGLRLEWDAINRLRKVWKNNNTPGSTGDDVLVGEYTYDAKGRRLQKVVTNSGSLNGTTQFFYDGWRVVEERDGSNNVLRQYTYGNYTDEPWTVDNRSGNSIASLNDNSGTDRYFYVLNTHYNVSGLTAEGSSSTPGSLHEAYQYDAYGSHTVINDGNDADVLVNFSANDVRTVGGGSQVHGNCLTYTGQRVDLESGFLYFKNRLYSSAIGRFLSRDPIGATADISLYSYVGGRVIQQVDTFGLACSSDSPYCGPDMTQFLENLIGSFDLWRESLGPVSRAAAVGWLKGIGMDLDWWSTSSFPLKYKYKTDNCPTLPECASTYWLCGECVQDHWIGNFMYGYAGRAFNLPDAFMDAAANDVQQGAEGDPKGDIYVDPPWDRAGYGLARLLDDAHKKGPVDLCATLKKDKKLWDQANDTTPTLDLPTFDSYGRGYTRPVEGKRRIRYPSPHAKNYKDCKECPDQLPLRLLTTTPGGGMGESWDPKKYFSK